MVNSQTFFLSKRILFTILVILFYRIGAYIPLPYGSVVTEKMLSFFSSFNLLHGGALSRSSIFSLNIMPYIVSSVIMQLLASGDKDYAADYAFSKKFKIRLLTMCLAFLQGFFLILSSGTLSAMMSVSALLNLLSLVAGSLLLMWLGELITTHGIGNGISLIISAGIIAEMPAAISKHMRALHSSAVSIEQLLFSVIFILLLLSFIVFIESSVRSIPVNYAKQHFSANSLAKMRSYIPLRVNTAGVIPPIFANAVLMLPVTILGFYRTRHNMANALAEFLSPGNAMYELLYALLIIFFCFFYTFIVFDPEKAAENIKKGGGIIFGYRPGKDTAVFLRSVVSKLTVVGSVYVVIVCMSTELMRLANISLFIIGGTSLLIIVGVVIDTIAQIQVHLFSGQYDKILQKTGLRRRS